MAKLSGNNSNSNLYNTVKQAKHKSKSNDTLVFMVNKNLLLFVMSQDECINALRIFNNPFSASR
jgi:hypothetical protein